jgi:hypothetical protein
LRIFGSTSLAFLFCDMEICRFLSTLDFRRLHAIRPSNGVKSRF